MEERERETAEKEKYKCRQYAGTERVHSSFLKFLHCFPNPSVTVLLEKLEEEEKIHS